MQTMLASNLYMIFQYAYAAQGIDYKWMNKVIRFFILMISGCQGNKVISGFKPYYVSNNSV